MYNLRFFLSISYHIPSYTHNLPFQMISPLIVDSLKVSLQAPGHIKSKVCDVKDFVRTNPTNLRMSKTGDIEPEEVLHVGCSPNHLLSALGTDAWGQTVPWDL